MIFKTPKFGLHFGKKTVEADDAVDIEQLADDPDVLADSLLTPMGENRVVAEAVDVSLPLISDEGDGEVAKAADALLTPMGGVNESGLTPDIDIGLNTRSNTDEKDEAKMKDVLSQPAEPEAVAASEEPSVESKEESGKEEIAEPESKGGDGFLDNLFDQEDEEEETSVHSLIASLPDISVDEVMSAVEEVKALMNKWQSNETER